MHSSTESKKERERDKEIPVLIDLWTELAQVTEWRLEAAHGGAEIGRASCRERV